jgi:hypothetical protein
LIFEIISYFKILKKILHAGWAAVGRKPGQAEGSKPVRCWLLHVRAAYDRHSYASIEKMLDLPPPPRFMNCEQWWCRTGSMEGI